MSQDFTKKMAIVVRNDLESWQVLNTVAHCSAFLGNKIKESFDTGEPFLTSDNKPFPRNSQYPIVSLSAKAGQLPALLEQTRASGLLYIAFIREMIDTTVDQEIIDGLKNKTEAQTELLGIGIFGENEAVKTLTKKFSLWK